MTTSPGSVFDALLPDVVVTEQLSGDAADAPLLGAELTHMSRAVLSRRQEYATVRLCARRAMARLHIPAAPIPSLPDGRPVWPEGVVGSMTHCRGLRAASIARSADLRSIGIDAEPHGALPEGVLTEIAQEGELDALEALRRADDGVAWDRVLFCAKESSFKAWYPLALRRVAFLAAQVRIDPDGTFDAQFPRSDGAASDRVLGSWAIAGPWVISAVTVA